MRFDSTEMSRDSGPLLVEREDVDRRSPLSYADESGYYVVE